MSDLQRYELDGVDCMAYCYGGSPRLSPIDPKYAALDKFDDGSRDWVKFPDAIAAIEAERARIKELEGQLRVADELERAANKAVVWVGYAGPMRGTHREHLEEALALYNKARGEGRDAE